MDELLLRWILWAVVIVGAVALFLFFGKKPE
jgi:hypothetical protein